MRVDKSCCSLTRSWAKTMEASSSISAKAGWRLPRRQPSKSTTLRRCAFAFRIPKTGLRQRDALRGSATPGKRQESNLLIFRRLRAQRLGSGLVWEGPPLIFDDTNVSPEFLARRRKRYQVLPGRRVRLLNAANRERLLENGGEYLSPRHLRCSLPGSKGLLQEPR